MLVRSLYGGDFMKIPLCVPFMDNVESDAVCEVLKSGWLAHGPRCKEFEEQFAKYIGVKYAVALNSCTSALQLAIMAQGRRGEIILPSFTFVASANSIVTSGCKPVFAEIEYETRNIDPIDIEKRITKDTVGIMPVHYGGQVCRMDEIMEIADKHGLFVVEDSAETIGGLYNTGVGGSFATGCFSFYPTKNMTTGEGGILTTNDDKVKEFASTMRGHGISSSTWARERVEKPWFRAAVMAGFNYRMCDILAAVGVVQMKKIDEMNELRRKHAQYLNKELEGLDGITVPSEMLGCKHVYQMYTITLGEAVDRTRFLALMREKGVGASVHFDPPVHLQPYYVDAYGCKKGDFPVSERLAETIVTLPMYPALNVEELDYIVSSLKDALRGSSG